MKTFNYHSAKDVKEASKLSSSSSAYLAGGMTTIPSMKLGLATYKDLIDIKGIKKLSGIKASGKTVRIGATTKHAEVARSKEVKKAIPSLAALAEGIVVMPPAKKAEFEDANFDASFTSFAE